MTATTKPVLQIIDDCANDACFAHYEQLKEARAAIAELIAAAKMARSTLATALKASCPDLFETDEDVAGHLTIKALDAALIKTTAIQGENVGGGE